VELSAMLPIALQIGIVIANLIAVCSDLRDHRAYMADHPGASAITTAQVCPLAQSTTLVQSGL
jgi:hypothetical protein